MANQRLNLGLEKSWQIEVADGKKSSHQLFFSEGYSVNLLE